MKKNPTSSRGYLRLLTQGRFNVRMFIGISCAGFVVAGVIVYFLMATVFPVDPGTVYRAKSLILSMGKVFKGFISRDISFGWMLSYIGFDLKQLIFLFRFYLLMYITVFCLIGVIAVKVLRKIDARHARNDIIRGTILSTPKEIELKAVSRNETTIINLGGFPVTEKTEASHTIVFGTSGSGKSESVFAPLIAVYMETGRKGLIIDSKGDTAPRFMEYEKKKYPNLLFNPVDMRSLKYTLFNDLKTASDIENFAVSLIPESSSTEEEGWRKGARIVCIALVYFAKSVGMTNNKDLFRFWTASPDQKREWLETLGDLGIEAINVLDKDSPKTASSYNGELVKFVSPIKYIQDGPFSVRNWIDSREGGFIFCVNTPNIQTTTKGAVTLFINVLASYLLSLQENDNRRITIMIDEFGALHHLTPLVSFITRGRSKGACVYLGIQDIPQIEHIYGEKHTSTILGSTSTKIAMRIECDKTAKRLEAIFGEQDYREQDDSFSVGVEEYKDGESLKKNRRRDPLILSSQFMTAKTYHAYIKGEHGICEADLRREKVYLTDRVRCVYPLLLYRKDLTIERMVIAPQPVETGLKVEFDLEEATIKEAAI